MPPGIHPASHEDIRGRLFGINAEQWIGGSFVGRTDNPNDIDLINLCRVDEFEQLSPEVRAMFNQYFKGYKTAKYCHCNSYFVPAAPERCPLATDFAIIHNYWKKKLSHDRGGYPKGIIVRLVETTDTAAPFELSDANAA